MSNRRKPSGPQRNVVRGRPARRRSRYSRHGQRNGVLLVVVALFVGIAGIALANAFSGQGGSSPTAADASGTPTPAATSSSPTPKPTQSTPAAKTASPTPAKTSRERHTAKPVASPKSTPKPSATADCPSASVRLARARAQLRHPSALPQATVITAGPRSGTLATADPPSGTITLYLRSCAEEPTTRLAVVWMFEAGQFLNVQAWDSGKQNQWRQLRGASLGSTTELQLDVAAVYAYWQTGSTESWQSSVAPPSPSQLNQLAPYLQ